MFKIFSWLILKQKSHIYWKENLKILRVTKILGRYTAYIFDVKVLKISIYLFSDG